MYTDVLSAATAYSESHPVRLRQSAVVFVFGALENWATMSQ